MRRTLYYLVCLLTGMILLHPAAQAALSAYTFSATSTTYADIDINSSTVLINSSGTSGTFNESATAGPVNIGFSFGFDGTTYTQFTVNTSGLMILGTATNSSYNNALESPPVSNPIMCAYWEHAHMYDGAATCSPVVYTHVSYILSGSAPNRVLIVEFGTQLYNQPNSTYYYAGNCLPMHNYQIRLYEGTNAISFTYGQFRQGTTSGIAPTASIGVAQGNNNFLSITPGSPATMSSTTANNSVDNYQLTSSTLISSGTVYTISPCGMTVAGRTGVNDGGTSAMKSGDTLFLNQSVQRGNSGTFTPFTLATPAGGCPTVSYSMSISGSTDYYFGAPGVYTASGTITSGNSTTPSFGFKPSATGKRYATLTVNDLTNGVSRNYILAATGSTRIAWIGNVPQGGTSTMASGDTLMKTIIVNRRSSGSFTPFTLQNFNANPAQTPAASISYILNDPSGQYTIVPTSTSIGYQQSSTPTITFAPTSVSYQPATLTVIADGEVRVFILYAFSAAPGADFILGGTKLGPTVGTFINYTGCVGDEVNTQAITVQNVGYGDVTIDQIAFYRIDTVYKQGTPTYPLLRDENNQPLRSYDYFITTQPGVAPRTANAAPQLPITVPTGQSRTIYLTFIGAAPGKRFARAFIRTNAQNFNGIDVYGIPVEGLLNFDLFGRSRGASLSDKASGGLPQAVPFPTTRVGDSVDVTFSLFNAGICDLHINKNMLRVFAGDASEFHLVTIFAGTPISGDDYVFAPGTSGQITARFIPSRNGTRRASVWLRTNDSTIYSPGINRGDYFLDLVGNGKAGLDVKPLNLPEAVIDAESATGAAFAANSALVAVTVSQMQIKGPDAAEFTEDPTNPWPARPFSIAPGEQLHLGIVHTPASGSQPGPRSAILEVTLGNSDIVNIDINGLAATRTIAVSPASLFNNSLVSIGSVERQTVVVTNTGTTKLIAQAPALAGADASEYSLTPMPRLTIGPGASEFLEVTYAPTKSGTANATITFASNATNGTPSVTLNAQSKAERGGDGGSPSIAAGVGSAQGQAGGIMLFEAMPNPASETVDIGYRLNSTSDVRLELYDASGALVSVIESGRRDAGSHTAKVDVSRLSSGVYHYRLATAHGMLTRTLVVTR